MRPKRSNSILLALVLAAIAFGILQGARTALVAVQELVLTD